MNRSDKTMFFGVGGHPGFKVPFQQEERFEDYYLAFGEKHVPTRVGHTGSCFLSGMDKDFLLKDGYRLPLAHEMFDGDAIVLKTWQKSDINVRQGRKKDRSIISGYALPGDLAHYRRYPI